MAENKFKGWCAAHNIKVKDIAELLNIEPNNASEKINKKQNFTLPQIKLICEKYGISADIFVLKELQTYNAEGGNNAEN